jgi:hypothetical protein
LQRPDPVVQKEWALAKRDSYLLRVDPAILKALKTWAADELRSLNGQIEFLLREALVQAGRQPKPGGARRPENAANDAGDNSGPPKPS